MSFRLSENDANVAEWLLTLFISVKPISGPGRKARRTPLSDEVHKMHTPADRIIATSLIVTGSLLACAAFAAANQLTLSSPNELVQAGVAEGGTKNLLTYTVRMNDQTVIETSSLGIIVDGANLARDAILGRPERYTVNETYSMLGGKSLATNHANGLRIPILTKGARWALECRAYDHGFAFRYIVPGRGRRRVQGETSAFRIPAGTRVWFAERPNAWKLKTYAGEFVSAPIEDMPTVSKVGPVQLAPLVCVLPAGGYAALAEAAVFGYPGMRYRAVGDNTFTADFPEGDPGFTLDGEIVTPWRVIIAAADLDALVNQTLVNNLARAPDPNLFEDMRYIMPGRSVWRWQLRGVGTLADQKHYVDYAQRLGYEYSLVDDGWEKDWPQPWRQVSELCRYARIHGVGIWVWKRWGEISDPAEDYAVMRAWMDRAKQAGVTGLKVDFFNAEDLSTRRGEEKVLAQAAKRRLLIDFHGCPKPTGEARTYPNELTREAVRGLELNFMSEADVSAAHNAALPFTRYIIGHADYTPLTFDPNHLGGTTIAHQLATCPMAVSPFQCINAFPDRMLDYPVEGVTEVLGALPAAWDETIVLPQSRIGDLALLARRSGAQWYVFGLNGGAARTCKVPFDFLTQSAPNALLFTDVPDEPARLRSQSIVVDPKKPLDISMEPGGGFLLRIP